MVHSAIEPYVLAARENPGPDPSTVSIEDRRSTYRDVAAAIRGDVLDLSEVRAVTLDLPGRTLRGRLYVPVDDEGEALVVYLHGGSFVLGDLDTHDALCRRVSDDTGMRILALEYRLAPEHPFPAAVEDATDAIRYVVEHVGEFDDPGVRVIVMGDSAGATLAAVACALTKDDGLGIAAQVLIYPTMGPEMYTESVHEYGVGYMLDVEHLRYDYSLYLGPWPDHSDPRVNPLMFDDLRSSPPAIVVVAECDPLRDEGVAYAGLLEHVSVTVEVLEAPGMIHGFLRMGGLVPEAMDIVDDLARHMHDYASETA